MADAFRPPVCLQARLGEQQDQGVADWPPPPRKCNLKSLLKEPNKFSACWRDEPNRLGCVELQGGLKGIFRAKYESPPLPHAVMMMQVFSRLHQAGT